jgi:putative endonuclease
MYCVYILLCSDNKTYIGCTNNLKDRIKRHGNGEITSTKNRLPVKLISYFTFCNKYTAYKFEKYLKSGSGRAFIKKHMFVEKY